MAKKTNKTIKGERLKMERMKKQWNSKDKWRKENDKPKKKQAKRYSKVGILIQGDRPPRRKFINGEEA